MLPQKNRLKKKKDFERVFKKGRLFKEGFLILRIAENGLKSSRFGFVISRKVSREAAKRNKIKRRLRELVRIKLTKIKTGIDGVIVVIPGFEVNNFQQLEKSVNKLFKKANILRHISQPKTNI